VRRLAAAFARITDEWGERQSADKSAHSNSVGRRAFATQVTTACLQSRLFSWEELGVLFLQPIQHVFTEFLGKVNQLRCVLFRGGTGCFVFDYITLGTTSVEILGIVLVVVAENEWQRRNGAVVL